MLKIPLFLEIFFTYSKRHPLKYAWKVAYEIAYKGSSF